jgi:hypothetical protein
VNEQKNKTQMAQSAKIKQQIGKNKTIVIKM